MRRLSAAIVPLTMPLVLAACFGGGGGSGGSLNLNSNPIPFTSFDDITGNSLVEAQSDASVNYDADFDAADGLSDAGTETREASALRLLFRGVDEDGDPQLAGARLTINFPDAPGRDPIVTDFTNEATETGNYIQSANVDQAEAVTDRLTVYAPDDENIEPTYMTFGFWELGLTNASRDLGGAAWGAPTPLDGDNSMPDGGQATYTGGLLGTHLIADPAGTTTLYQADSTVVANFGANTVVLTSANTRTLAAQPAPNSNLNLTNTTPATIAGNTFSGGDSRTLGNVTGSFGGQFFGPDAAEVGGWFSVVNTNGDRYFGSFGGIESVN